MKLLSVNVGQPQTVNWGGHPLMTAIFKVPVAGRHELGRRGLPGDAQADTRAHGGPDKAALVYTHENYTFWQQELDRPPFPMAQFGETLTVEGMRESDVQIGDIFRIGEALVQVTQPRTPCLKLAIRMEFPTFPKRYLKSGRVGFYLRVLEEGLIGAGDRIELVERAADSITICDLSELIHFHQNDIERLKHAVSISALAKCWKDDIHARIANADDP